MGPKIILQIKDGIEINKFNSITDACKIGFNRDMIGRCLKGKYKQYKGFQWQTREAEPKKVKIVYNGKVSFRRLFRREYLIYNQMKYRCACPTNKMYRLYGGRGISVCERWLQSFDNFFVDMGPCPIGYSLDRMDNNGNYGLLNCRWATAKEQSNNTRRNVFINARGQRRTISEWSEITGIKQKTISKRLHNNWNIENLFEDPSRLRRS